MCFDRLVGIAFLIVCFGLIALVGTAAVGSIRSNGSIDYCYVEMLSPPGMAPQYQLYGHRPWRLDRAMGVYPTIDEARSKADTIGCRFGGN